MSTIRRREKKQENNPNKHNSTGSFHPNRDGAGFLSWCMLGGWTGMLRTPEHSEEEEEHRIENSKVVSFKFPETSRSRRLPGWIKNGESTESQSWL